MKLYVARHGETTWNKEHKICGRTEVSLTEKGWEQAAALAERVSGLGISAIVASPMRRAQDTAACVGKRLGLPVQTDLAWYRSTLLLPVFPGLLTKPEHLHPDLHSHKNQPYRLRFRHCLLPAPDNHSRKPQCRHFRLYRLQNRSP